MRSGPSVRPAPGLPLLLWIAPENPWPTPYLKANFRNIDIQCFSSDTRCPNNTAPQGVLALYNATGWFNRAPMEQINGIAYLDLRQS